jgi:hypothetical protein
MGIDSSEAQKDLYVRLEKDGSSCKGGLIRIVSSWPEWISPACYLVLIMGLALILYLVNFNSFQIGTYVDDAHYIVLARALAAGKGFKLVNYPTPKPDIMSSAGWPLLMTPVTSIWHSSLVALKLYTLVWTLLSVYLVYLNFRIDLPTGVILIVVALYALNPDIVGSASMVMSEPAYLVFSLLGLHLFAKFREGDFSKWYQIPLLGFVLSWTYMIRTVGAVLMLAVLFEFLSHKRWKQATFFCFFFLIFLFPQILVKRGGNAIAPSTEWHQVTTLIISREFDLVLSKLWHYLSHLIPRILFGAFGPLTYVGAEKFRVIWLVEIMKLTLLSIVFIGALRSIKKDTHAWYALLYLLVLGFKSGRKFTERRYLIPLIPFLYYYFIKGLGTFAAKASNILPVIPKYLIVLLPTAVIILVSLGRGVDSFLHPVSEEITDISVGTTWISEHSPSDSTIMCRNPVARSLYAERKTIDFPDRFANERAILRYIDDNDITHILIAPKMQLKAQPRLDSYQTEHIVPLLNDHPEVFQQVFANEERNVKIYTVHMAGR